ncbi:beta family protein [Qipengyuania gaetbuli]|uniref:beta family protein n=1 Tax=Qipengyuania gaetbuli TaxID=266952 RepID=UPI001CFE6F89|nr:beta family protein [Qipengyuania gaetbuli]
MFQGLDYVPLLHARLAEIRALEGLEDVTKRRIFPIVRVRPWFNARSIDRAYEVIEEAIGEGNYGFDLDSTKFDPASERPSMIEFARLFDPDHGYENYYDTVFQGQYRIPVYRGLADPDPQIAFQLEHVARIGRGLIVRVPITSPGAYLAICEQCLELGINNTAFVFDAGWRQDVLEQSGVTVGLVNSLFDITDQFEVSVAASSFPDQFQDMGERASRPIREVEFFDTVRGQVNRGNFTYGDWGSTRSPTEGGFARVRPRIDMADVFNWTFWRSDGEETYEEICQRVVADQLWDGNLDAWGKFLIQSTADQNGTIIKSPVMAAAARVNLHLIAQAHKNDPEGYQTPDTPVGDQF